MGRALGWLAHDLGIQVVAFYNTTSSRAEETRAVSPHATHYVSTSLESLAPHLTLPRLVWICVADDAIASVAHDLHELIHPESVVLHTSGSISSRVLRDAGIEAPCASLHPLLAITDPREGATSFSQCAWSVEGDDVAILVARQLMHRIGVEPLAIDPASKGIYHAAAVTSANLVVALFDLALEMAQRGGIDRERARAMLLPLLRSSVANLEHHTPEEALTGPVSRGDEATIARHERALATHPELLEIYVLLTARARSLAARASEEEE